MGKKAKTANAMPAKLAKITKQVKDEAKQKGVEENVEEKTMETKINFKRKLREETNMSAKKSKLDCASIDWKERAQRSLFCKEIPPSTSENKIAELFEGVEEVIKYVSPSTGFYAGNCFIVFNSIEEKDAAFAMRSRIKFEGSTLFLTNTSGDKLCKVVRRKSIIQRMLLCRNLPYTADVNEITGLFKGVKNIRIFGRRKSGKCQGYCTIEFFSKEERELALATEDAIMLGGRTLHLMNMEYVPQTIVDTLDHLLNNKHSEETIVDKVDDSLNNKHSEDETLKTIVVKGITNDMTKYSLLSIFGGAIDARIPVHKDTSRNKSFAYVDFESESDAASWLAETEGGIKVNGVTLFGSSAQNIKSRRCDRGDQPKATLLVKGFKRNMTRKYLLSLFDGAIDARIPRHHITGLNKSFGYIDFPSESDAASCLKKDKKGIKVDGGILKVIKKPRDEAFKEKHKKDQTSKTIFVNGISNDMTKDSLLSLFDGAINAKIPVHWDTSRNKGYGFVEFATETDASSSYSRTKDGIDVDGFKLRVDYSPYKKRNEETIVDTLDHSLNNKHSEEGRGRRGGSRGGFRSSKDDFRR